MTPSKPFVYAVKSLSSKTIRVLSAYFQILLVFQTTTVAQTVPLPAAHAHNDYEHAKPLMEALSYGFTSIEADVYLIEGELFVSHYFPEPGSRRTLKELYLEPLRARIKENQGQVFAGDSTTLLLTIDIKSKGEATYQVLRKQLAEYASILRFPGHPGPVSVVLSGNRPIQTVLADQTRMVSIDGRPDDLDKGYPADFMPIMSENYGRVLRWKGEGPIPEEEMNRLQTLTRRAHAQGKRVRLWASPEREEVWKTLLEGGADLISTDQLERLNKFLFYRFLK
jgi:hypothetical protein